MTAKIRASAAPTASAFLDSESSAASSGWHTAIAGLVSCVAAETGRASGEPVLNGK